MCALHPAQKEQRSVDLNLFACSHLGNPMSQVETSISQLFSFCILRLPWTDWSHCDVTCKFKKLFSSSSSTFSSVSPFFSLLPPAQRGSRREKQSEWGRDARRVEGEGEKRSGFCSTSLFLFVVPKYLRHSACVCKAEVTFARARWIEWFEQVAKIRINLEGWQCHPYRD